MSNVRTPTAAVADAAEDLALIAALMGGTRAMRAAGKAYLPQWPNESDDAFDARLRTATLFPAFARTVEVLAAKPFSRPITLGDDIPARVRDWTEDIDLQGRSLHSYAASLADAVLAEGMAGILVDYPTKDKGVKTVADERRAGLRPYFVHIRKGDILGWRSKRVRGVETLTQLRLLEQATIDDGPFGEKAIEQVRVLYIGKWEVWRETEQVDAEGKKIWVIYQSGTTTLKRIPFIPVYGKRTGFMTAVPPLMELAHSNVEHWQSKSDQQTILHVARVPILFAKNLGDAQIVVGASTAIKADGPDADMKFVEHTGKAIEAGRLSLLDLEDRMRQAGAELLVIKPGNVTEVQTLADNEQGMCALQRIAHDEEDAIDAALQLMAEWVGETQGGHVTIYKEFGAATLAQASLELLRDMTIDGTLSDETLFREAQRRGVISPELDWNGEKDRIAKNLKRPAAPVLQD
ncbi:DNA-binding protein [Pandoraea pnomenusa]|uniref:DUF4055 domain-containing protein n=1 Tax=Pandoraea pnomenusa TaxID=93220 RepID=A0A379KEE9_9BURK|nr:DUF4055 domain-containing protein [Pandoraea pnomenusa]AIU29347.1 DNA-binding protein [Pandoraea pnomenusa]SUA81996.1 Uncharacterised protein [Pandoraea pnomenusa]SUD65812.1 Uncharacterised protein [Pandoraea pnomenusa]